MTSREANVGLVHAGRSTATPDDRHAIAEVHQRAVGAVSAASVEMTLFFFYEIRDGRALRFTSIPTALRRSLRSAE